MDVFGDQVINKGIIIVIILGSIMVFTVLGNILVILSIFTYRPLHNVQNMFMVSLAVADIMVAVLVMPLNVAYNIIGKWIFGIFLCQMWLTSDVMCCTASILNLCAIALDRYWAIHDPINYAHKRTMKRVLIMIGLVWIISALISIPPLIGWNDWPDVFDEDTPCKLSSERAYLIYSSSGSFFIPLIIMTVVYIKIFQVTRKRLRDRQKASAMTNLMSGQTHGCKSVHGSDENNGHQNKTIENDDSAESDEKGDKMSQPTTITTLTTTTHPKVNFAEKEIEKSFSASASGPSQLVPSSDGIDQESIDRVSLVFQKDLNDTKQQKSVGNRVKKKDSVKMKIKDETSTTSSMKSFWEEKQRISLSRERRATRILGIVMGVFVACWLPFFLMYIIVPFFEINLMPEIENFITWLGYINSALNPLIYCGFNRDFRKAFQKIICCKKVVL